MAATREDCRIRDIPASCTCTGWAWNGARWVLPRPQPACPWHRRTP